MIFFIPELNRTEPKPNEAASAHVVNAQSSSVILSIGAPSFGGGGSFDTLDFSLPSYDDATSGGGDIAKSSSSSSSSFTAPTAPSKVDDSAASRAAAREEKEASRIAEAEAREAQKRADEVAAKEAAEKAAAKEAAKEERKASGDDYHYYTLAFTIPPRPPRARWLSSDLGMYRS